MRQNYNVVTSNVVCVFRGIVCLFICFIYLLFICIIIIFFLVHAVLSGRHFVRHERNEMFYLTTHSTYFNYGYMSSEPLR